MTSHFNPAEKRDKVGRWFKEIHASDLSTPDARRSPEVTSEEFQDIAARGKEAVDRLKGRASEPAALQGKPWEDLKHEAFTASREPWGGLTVDAHSGEHVRPDADSYALTVRDPNMESVHVDPKADEKTFHAAMETAKQRYADILSRPGHHLGVFHDADTNSIDIDPVLVTPHLKDVHEIGAYTRAVGGAYHFKSGDGFWPPHVRESKNMNLSVQTPWFGGESVIDLADDGKIAFWKQILPKRQVHYTGKDGKRHVADFNEQYLTDLANNKMVDKIGFLLADKDNTHTMDPERWRGDVVQMEVREDGLYGKIVFPNREAAKAVLANPDLPVSARIVDGERGRSDGTSVNRGIIHVLGTLDPQVSGMSGWQVADLSAEAGDLLDLSTETFDEEKDMATKHMLNKDGALIKPVEDFTEEEIAELDDATLEVFLHDLDALLEGSLDDDDDAEDETEDDVEDTADEKEPEMALSHQVQSQIDLANARAEQALKALAAQRWEKTRDDYLAAGVPPHLLDLAAPVLSTTEEFVVDLSNEGSDTVNVEEIVRGLLDAAKGTIDLSVESGHSGTFNAGDGNDPDAEGLALWDNQF